MTNGKSTPADETGGWKYAEKAMSWYGWGSPVGLAFALIGLGTFVLLLRIAIVGV